MSLLTRLYYHKVRVAREGADTCAQFSLCGFLIIYSIFLATIRNFSRVKASLRHRYSTLLNARSHL